MRYIALMKKNLFEIERIYSRKIFALCCLLLDELELILFVYGYILGIWKINCCCILGSCSSVRRTPFVYSVWSWWLYINHEDGVFQFFFFICIFREVSEIEIRSKVQNCLVFIRRVLSKLHILYIYCGAIFDVCWY